MLILWRIRYLDRTDKQFKDRDLFLDTDTLPPAMRAAVEIAVETKTSQSEREFLKYRSLYWQQKPQDVAERWQAASKTTTFSIPNYFEDETGTEITLYEMGPVLTGDPTARFFPGNAKQHDIDLMLAEPTPIPLVTVSLTQDEIRLLGYFTRDFAELSASAFMKDGPGIIKSSGYVLLPFDVAPVVETAVTDDEIRSFVTIFRRLYMKDEPANFRKAVAVYVDALGDHPHARWVAGVASEYEAHLTSAPQHARFVQAIACTFTTKRLIDVFLYTQYAHQPDERRQRQFSECLNQVHGKRSVLTWMFLTELWKCGLEIGNAGRVIADWFKHYCDHHGVLPDIVNSLRQDHLGLGSVEKKEDRKARLFREAVEGIEMELWKQAGRPEGGPVQFRAMARDQLNRSLGVEAKEGS